MAKKNEGNKVEITVTWMEDFTARMAYKRAEDCLKDALLVAREREHESLAVLVDASLAKLRIIGRIFEVNGRKLLDEAIDAGEEQ